VFQVPRIQDALFIVFLLSYQTAVTKGLIYLRDVLRVRPLSKGFAPVKDKIQWGIDVKEGKNITDYELKCCIGGRNAESLKL